MIVEFIVIIGARDEPDPRFWKPGFGAVTRWYQSCWIIVLR